MKSTEGLQFRPLTAVEAGVLARLLEVDEPLYGKLREQLADLCAATLDQWGSFALTNSKSAKSGRAKIRGSLPYLGVARDADQVPIQFAVFVDEVDWLSAVEVTRLDGGPLRAQVMPQSISLQRDEPGADI